MLSQKAVLISLTISLWTGRKLDKRATESVETTFSTNRGVGNFTKKLLPDSKELDLIKSIANESRQFLYEQTSPWLNDGSRILSSKNIFDFGNAIRQRKAKFEAAVSDFLSVYSLQRADAQTKLGSLFRADDYPHVESLKDAFTFKTLILPMPEVTDFRVEVLDSEKDALLESLREVQNRALQDCYDRLKAVVSKAAETLNSPKAIFRDSLIENISEICQLLPKLNVNDDAALETTRLEVESIVSKISPETLRENKDERQAAADKLREINAKLGAFMGVSTSNFISQKVG